MWNWTMHAHDRIKAMQVVLASNHYNRLEHLIVFRLMNFKGWEFKFSKFLEVFLFKSPKLSIFSELGIPYKNTTRS